MSTKIIAVHGRQILDSRGNPTVEADVRLEGGIVGRAAVPSGASTGEHEAIELRDGDKSHYLGKGVLKAVGHINGEIAKAVSGMDAADQRALDRRMIEADGTPNKSKFGANAILAVSMAAARAAAAAAGQPLYKYLAKYSSDASANMLPGPDDEHPQWRRARRQFRGRAGIHGHAPWRAEFSRSAALGRRSFPRPESRAEEERLLDRRRRRRRLRAQPEIKRRSARPRSRSHHRRGIQARRADRHRARSRRKRILRRASKKYVFKKSDKSARTSEQMVAFWADWVRQYPIVSIEDGLAENDWDGWKLITKELGKKIQLVGDDLFVTNPKIFARGISEGIANAILIKLNQIGSVTETIEAVEMARKAKYASIISHRSGETEDAFIADFAVAMGAGQIKTGSASRTDRIAKYNQLLRIEEELGSAARFPGRAALAVH